MSEDLELRMYFFVPYNISDIQKGIQAGHAALEYANTYGSSEKYKDFIENHKTWIILNGGTTNNNYDGDDMYVGSLNNIVNELMNNNIECEIFNEPDLNDALTAVCFIADERVFNFKKYPDIEYFEEHDVINDNNKNIYERWVDFMGGEKNVFLRELIKNKKLA